MCVVYESAALAALCQVCYSSKPTHKVEPLYTYDSTEAPLCVSFMRVLQCCSTELAAPGRHAAVLKRHTMWSLYIHVMDTVCCSAGLAALVRYTTGKLWICSIMLQVQKSKRKVLVTTVKWGRLTTCNCSIILHKVHFLPTRMQGC